MSEKQKETQILGTERLEAFSDSVFAIVMTLLFIELRLPEVSDKTDWRNLLAEIWKLKAVFFSIFISFTFVAIFWTAHHQFFRTLQKTTRGLLFLNVAFLFFVSFVPFPASIMSRSPDNPTAVVFFGATVLMTSILLVVLRWYAWFKHEEISDISTPTMIRQALSRSLVMVGIYAVGIGVSFFYPLAAVVIYLLTPLTLLFPVTVEVESKDEAGEEQKTEVVL